MGDENRDYSRADMLNSIKSLNFAVIELGLYLNTHPDDERALCLHREYCRQLKDIKDKYQNLKFNWVKGHDNDKYNIECDAMCQAKIREGVAEVQNA